MTVNLTYLIDEVKALEDLLEKYLDSSPSPRVTHHARGLSELRTALIVEKGLLLRKAQQEADRDERWQRDQEIRQYDAHTRAMAERLNMSPSDFLAEQERRRQELDAPKPAPVEVATKPPVVDDMEDPNDR